MHLDRARIATLVSACLLAVGGWAVSAPLAYAAPPEQKFTCDKVGAKSGTYEGFVVAHGCKAADGSKVEGRGKVKNVKIVEKGSGTAYQCRSAAVGTVGGYEAEMDDIATRVEGHGCK